MLRSELSFIEKITSLDTELFLFLNGCHSPFFDTVMWAISGTYIWLPLYAMLLFFLIRKYKLKTISILVFVAITITLSDQVSVHLFKEVFQRLRPCHNPLIDEMVHIVNNYRGGQFGFVSSHAANTFALATFISLIFSKKYFTLFIFVWAIIVSYSRIYLGVHYPFDILCGALVGVFAGIVVHRVYMLIKKKIPGRPYI